ncbi:Retrovirus-related Pol polyprotein from transposon TNT 1-94 [Eumeta japonica]|uniref:Retrovirus-related Pol polyprotein from transposon TNT 1-94 n=1 Tax=Eumeta variegata TaxID=151549 RepID=A0A4C1UBW6_EUMVA|nr:Retrovirus-related Pol polyprotein from transposon TNT 1-94 [Eumeta japonica]
MEKVPGDFKCYKSVDTVCTIEDTVHYPQGFLNSLNTASLPTHELKLKGGIPIMLLKNLCPPSLCNGTRLLIKELRDNVIVGILITGPAARQLAHIPRIPIIPTDLPISFKSHEYARKEDETHILIAEKKADAATHEARIRHRQEQKDALDIGTATGYRCQFKINIMSSEEIEVVPEIPMLDDEQMNVDNESEGEDDEDDDHGDDVDNSEEVMTDASNNSSRTTSPMFNHLRAKHKDIYEVCIEERNRKRKSSDSSNDQGKEKKRKESTMTRAERQEIDQLIMEMIAIDLKPFSCVEDRGFKNLLKKLAPEYEPPCRTTFSRSLAPILYHRTKQKLLNNLEEDLQLDVENVPVFFITDNARNISLAISQLSDNHLYCVAHTLNLVLKYAESETPGVEELLTKFRKIAGHFHRSDPARQKFEAAQRAFNCEPLQLVQMVVTRWNSEYEMLERMERLQKPLSQVLADSRDSESISGAEWSKIPDTKTFYEEDEIKDIEDDIKLEVIKFLIPDDDSQELNTLTRELETGQKLAGTGFNISDEWIGSLLLAGLTEKLSPMIMAIEHSGMSITTDAIKSKLLDMETEVNGSDSAAFGSFNSRLYQHKKPIDKNKSLCQIEEVMCVPSLTTNLLSVSQLINKGNKVSFRESGFDIYNRMENLVATGTLVNGVYKLNTPVHLSAAAVVSNEMWHRRLGHVNSTYLNKMQNAVEGLSIEEEADISKSSCVTYCKGKQSRLLFPSNGNRCTQLLNVVHTDVCGPMENVSIGGSRYFIIFIDDYSQMIHIYFMKNKHEAFQCFKDYAAKVENLLDRKIKVLRSDNALEFCSKEFKNFLKQKGIVHQKSNPYTPQQNGLSERMNRTIIEKARCFLFDANMKKEFWAEETNTAVYLQNRTVSATLNNKTPYELWTNSKPDISHIRVFGSTVMKHVPKKKRLKWDKKSEECILVGYAEDTKGYRIYNPQTKWGTIVSQNESFISADNAEDSTFVLDESENSDSSTASTNSVVKRLPARERHPPKRYSFTNMCTASTTELSLEKALNGPKKEHWLRAVQEELQCFEDNNA